MADLDLVEEFLNTLDRRSFTRHGQAHAPHDALDTTADLSAWFAAHDLPAEVSGDDLATVLDVRTALRAGLSGQPTRDLPLRLSLDGSVRADTGVAGLDVLVETVATAVVTGRWARLKLCAAPDCRWAFHDTSRSGGGRWCSMQVCGNRAKTRTYRHRSTPGSTQARRV